MKFGKFIFTQQSTVIIGKTLNLLTVNQANLHISLAILNAQKKADHILEMADLGLFCDYRFINHISKIRL